MIVMVATSAFLILCAAGAACMVFEDAIYSWVIRRDDAKERRRAAKEERLRWEAQAASMSPERAGARRQALAGCRGALAELDGANTEGLGSPLGEERKRVTRLRCSVRAAVTAVEEDPKAPVGPERLANYYIPLAKTLAEAYAEMARAERRDPSIEAAEREVEEAMDMLCEGFRRIAQGPAVAGMDSVLADVAVLKAVAVQDGFLEGPFERAAAGGQRDAAW